MCFTLVFHVFLRFSIGFPTTPLKHNLIFLEVFGRFMESFREVVGRLLGGFGDMFAGMLGFFLKFLGGLFGRINCKHLVQI